MDDRVRTLVDGRVIVNYPFPLSTGTIATIELPYEPLSARDADRLIQFILALADAHPSIQDKREGE